MVKFQLRPAEMHNTEGSTYFGDEKSIVDLTPPALIRAR